METEAVRALHMVIPVWGARYITALTDLTIPFLLAPGNLPGLRRPDLFTIKLMTMPDDASQIAGHPAVQRAGAWARVVVETLPAEFPRRMTHLPLFSRAYALAIEQARAENADVICLCADSAVANGGLAAIERVRAMGRRCIYISGHRVVQAKLTAWVAPYRQDDGAIVAPTRDLVRFAIAARHEWTDRVTFGDGVVRPVPGFFWRDRSNLLATSLLLHPLYLDTRATPADFAAKSVTSIDGDAPSWLECPPQDIHVFDDSDDFFAFEFSDHVAVPERQDIPGDSDAWLTAWADSVCAYIRSELMHRPGLPAYLHNLNHKIRYHAEDVSDIDPKIEALSDGLMARVCEIMRRDSPGSSALFDKFI